MKKLIDSALPLVIAVYVLVFPLAAFAQTNCLYASFSGPEYGVVRFCFLDANEAKVDAIINGPNEGILGFCWPDGSCDFRSPDVSTFVRGSSCLQFLQGWAQAGPPSHAVLEWHSDGFLQRQLVPLLTEAPANIRQLEGCQHRPDSGNPPR